MAFIKAIARVLSWIGVVLFGFSVVGTFVAKLNGSYLSDNVAWVIQETIQSALFALSLWGVVRLRTIKPKEPLEQTSAPRPRLRVTHAINAALVLIIIGSLFSIGMPHMIDRSVKENYVGAFSAGKSAAKFSQDYYVKNRRWPTQPEFSSQSFVTAAAKGVKSISMADDGSITVVMTGARELDEKSIQLRPTALQGGISWTCASDYEQRGISGFLNRQCNEQFPRD